MQEIAGVYFPVKLEYEFFPPELKRELKKLEALKRDFYYGRKEVKEEEIKKIEKDFYCQIIDYKIEKLRESLRVWKAEKEGHPEFGDIEETFGKSVKQRELAGNMIRRIEKEIKDLEEQKRLIHKKKHAFWAIEFAEVFLKKGGFDIVIANPPYVRQEKICDPYKPESTLEERKEYKEKLMKAMEEDWGKRINKLDKKADIYVYFYLKGLKLLNPEGVFCYISSNSWLDVGYGKNLQEFLLRNVPMIAIYDNQKKRSFKQADINTIIALFGAPRDNALENVVKFVLFKRAFEDICYSEYMIEIDKTKEKLNDEKYRVIPVSQKELLKEGMETEDELHKEHGVYVGSKWGGKYLRAPDIFFTILEKGKDKLVRLGDIAEVRFGIKTGANEFFYVEDVTDLIEDES